jgi:hypothetical protein
MIGTRLRGDHDKVVIHKFETSCGTDIHRLVNIRGWFVWISQLYKFHCETALTEATSWVMEISIQKEFALPPKSRSDGSR